MPQFTEKWELATAVYTRMLSVYFRGYRRQNAVVFASSISAYDCIATLMWPRAPECVPARLPGHLSPEYLCASRKYQLNYFYGQELALSPSAVVWWAGDGITRKPDSLLHLACACPSLWPGRWIVGGRHHSRRLAKRTAGCRWYEFCSCVIPK